MIGIFIIIWLLSFVATVLIFINKEIPCTPANFILAVIPVLNTIIVIKSVLFNNIFKEMKDTLKIIFINHKKEIIRIGNHQYIKYHDGYQGSICHYEDCDYCKQHRGY